MGHDIMTVNISQTFINIVWLKYIFNLQIGQRVRYKFCQFDLIDTFTYWIFKHWPPEKRKNEKYNLLRFSLFTRWKKSRRREQKMNGISLVSGKFACKILIQGFSYAFPVNLTIPVSISLLIAACGLRNTDPCIFQGTIPDYLFYESPPTHFINDFVSKQYAWVWLLWLLSQTWITLHVWTPKCERLAATEKLFVVPMYNSLLIDQSMGLNRKRDDQPEVKVEVIYFKQFQA